MKRKVCCFLESFELGGIEVFITEVLLHCDISDLEIDVIATKISKNACYDTLKGIGVNFIELSGKPRSPKNFSLFKQIVKTKHYDVIHFNIFHGLALNYVRIAKKLSVPSRIVHAHGAGLRKSRTRFVKLFLHRFCRFLFKKCPTHYLACSESAAKFLYGNIPAKIISNGIETEAFRFSPQKRIKMRRELGLEDEVLISHVGRMSNEKNHRFLLSTFKFYTDINPNSRLALAGDGPLREELEDCAKELNISDKVKFLGNISNVADLLCASDFFVFPSIVEGLGIAAIEAQASGLFTICSDAVPPEAKITDRFVSLPINDPCIWAEEISALPFLINRDYYADAVKNAGFDISTSAHQIGNLYRGD